MATAIIPGSFDPMTLGHVDLVRRTAAVFDSVTLLVMINDKKQAMFSPETRLLMAKESIQDIKNAKAEFYGGMTYDYVTQNNIDVIVKGIRTAQDLDWEHKIEQFNKEHAPKTETMLIFTRLELEQISSSRVKADFASGADVSKMVPSCVLEELLKTR